MALSLSNSSGLKPSDSSAEKTDVKHFTIAIAYSISKDIAEQVFASYSLTPIAKVAPWTFDASEQLFECTCLRRDELKARHELDRCIKQLVNTDSLVPEATLYDLTGFLDQLGLNLDLEDHNDADDEVLQERDVEASRVEWWLPKTETTKSEDMLNMLIAQVVDNEPELFDSVVMDIELSPARVRVTGPDHQVDTVLDQLDNLESALSQKSRPIVVHFIDCSSPVHLVAFVKVRSLFQEGFLSRILFHPDCELLQSSHTEAGIDVDVQVLDKMFVMRPVTYNVEKRVNKVQLLTRAIAQQPQPQQPSTSKAPWFKLAIKTPSDLPSNNEATHMTRNALATLPQTKNLAVAEWVQQLPPPTPQRMGHQPPLRLEYDLNKPWTVEQMPEEEAKSWEHNVVKECIRPTTSNTLVDLSEFPALPAGKPAVPSTNEPLVDLSGFPALPASKPAIPSRNAWGPVAPMIPRKVHSPTKTASSAASESKSQTSTKTSVSADNAAKFRKRFAKPLPHAHLPPSTHRRPSYPRQPSADRQLSTRPPPFTPGQPLGYNGRNHTLRQSDDKKYSMNSATNDSVQSSSEASSEALLHTGQRASIAEAGDSNVLVNFFDMPSTSDAKVQKSQYHDQLESIFVSKPLKLIHKAPENKVPQIAEYKPPVVYRTMNLQAPAPPSSFMVRTGGKNRSSRKNHLEASSSKPLTVTHSAPPSLVHAIIAALNRPIDGERDIRLQIGTVMLPRQDVSSMMQQLDISSDSMREQLKEVKGFDKTHRVFSLALTASYRDTETFIESLGMSKKQVAAPNYSDAYFEIICDRNDGQLCRIITDANQDTKKAAQLLKGTDKVLAAGYFHHPCDFNDARLVLLGNEKAAHDEDLFGISRSLKTQIDARTGLPMLFGKQLGNYQVTSVRLCLAARWTYTEKLFVEWRRVYDADIGLSDEGAFRARIAREPVMIEQELLWHELSVGLIESPTWSSLSLEDEKMVVEKLGLDEMVKVIPELVQQATNVGLGNSGVGKRLEASIHRKQVAAATPGPHEFW